MPTGGGIAGAAAGGRGGAAVCRIGACMVSVLCRFASGGAASGRRWFETGTVEGAIDAIGRGWGI